MKQDIEYWRARLNEVMPDQHIAEIELNQDGLVNDVVIVNDELVFRFAKTEHDADALAREMIILDLVRPRLKVSIPKPIHYERGCMVYPYLRGQPLLRETVLAVDERAQTSIAGTLGMLLYALHTAPLSEPGQEVEPTVAPASREQTIDIRTRVR
jgi:aminoglycoside 2''-phosphotransferase